MKTLCRCLIEGQKYGLRTSIPGVLGLTFRAFFLILTRGLEHVVCLGESRLSQVNNSPRANVFPPGMANFGKAMYQSLERSTKIPAMDFFCTVPRPHFRGRALIWPGYFGEHILGLFGLHPSSLPKSAVFWESFIGFYISCYPITTILACLFSVGVQIPWKVVLNESMAAKMASLVSYLVCYNCI